MLRVHVLAAVVLAGSVVGCTDKAEPEYARCMDLEKRGELVLAARACEAAIRQDPHSKSGVAAAGRLKSMQPALDAQRAAERRAYDDSHPSDDGARAAKAAALKSKVRVKSWGAEPDAECSGKGLPPFRKSYEGGTFEEDELVAEADGCTHLFQRRGNMNDSVFCCPR
ncbi:hypothetical protein WMF20_41950 [Sorangium sp. So ce834]|uniref:hypothetical protein n=1 Tax=Sorangium sp. So ce834 TaxID=3133321 RepID=UPI003F6019BC